LLRITSENVPISKEKLSTDINKASSDVWS